MKGTKKGAMNRAQRPLRFLRLIELRKLPAFALLQLFDHLRHDFEEVADHAEVGITYGFSATTLPSFHT